MNEDNRVSKKVEPENRFVNEHLANERTFLAWIRTAGAIIGIGFVAIAYYAENQADMGIFSSNMTIYIGTVSLSLGMFALGFSLYSYLMKRRGINNQTFRSSKFIVIIMSTAMMLITAFYALYLLIIYIY
ncbi:YidH family protein [Evansella halocellulosilytica]|uniref:YidH family protein n=1 Tax=Evansella halocellulosilytica TaxID=2011013 RepID=UPI000BB758AE|nr:DUF202 domain-containing protein [Evansella halocellulosilytica]